MSTILPDATDLPAGWSLVRLGEVLKLRRDLVHPRDKPTGAAVFVGLEHIESGTGVRTGCVEVNMATLTGRKPRFCTGDIVYGYLRPYLNKVWLADFDGLCSVDQYVYSVVREVAEPEYVATYMRSEQYLKAAPISTTPGQLPRIRTEEVASVAIPLPPLAEQHRIVALLEEQLDVVERARAAARAQAQALDALPGALLRQAFSGKV